MEQLITDHESRVKSSLREKEKSRRIAGQRENEIINEFENYLIEYFKKKNLSVKETVYLLETATENIKDHMIRAFRWDGVNPPSQSHQQG